MTLQIIPTAEAIATTQATVDLRECPGGFPSKALTSVPRRGLAAGGTEPGF